MKFIPLIFVLLLLSPFVYAAVNENVGVDAIFLDVGLEKPYEWSTWSKNQKFDYLKSRGIYPLSGNRYAGTANIDGFFTWLGVEKPTNWDQLSYEQKKSFVSAVQNPTEFLEQKDDVQDKPTPFKIIAALCFLAVIVGSFVKVRSKSREYIRDGIYYGLPLILLVLSLLSPEREFFANLGEWSERLLLFLLIVKPLAMIFRWKYFIRAVNYRRESGIASFWFFIFHAGGLIFVRNLLSLSYYSIPFLFWGLVAGVGMLILTFTSNDESLHYLKKNWKRIQYLAYPVLLAVLVHSSLWANGNLNKFFIYGGIFTVLKVVEFSGVHVKRKKK